jgi:hypothetical protein
VVFSILTPQKNVLSLAFMTHYAEVGLNARLLAAVAVAGTRIEAIADEVSSPSVELPRIHLLGTSVNRPFGVRLTR